MKEPGIDTVLTESLFTSGELLARHGVRHRNTFDPTGTR